MPTGCLCAHPKKGWTICGTDDGHGAAVGGADAGGERRAILELAVGQVACRTCHCAVAAEPRVEKQLPAEFGCARIIGDAVGRIGWQRFERSDPQGSERIDFR